MESGITNRWRSGVDWKAIHKTGRPGVFTRLQKLVFSVWVVFFIITPQSLIAGISQDDSLVVIAVLEMLPENVPPGEAALATELLRNELLKSGRYTLVEKQRLDVVIEEQDFQHSGVTQNEMAVQLGRLLNVNKVFLGTMGAIQDVRFLTVRVVNVETGQVEASAVERGFGTRDTEQAVVNVVYSLHGLVPPEVPQTVSDWTRDYSDVIRYVKVYTGPNVGSLVNFRAESAFESGPVSGEPLWSGKAAEVKSVAPFPCFGIRLGAWERWFGGDLEISAISHNTTAQSVFYDIKGYIWVPDLKVFQPVVLDTLRIPDKFERFFSLGIGGNFYINIPSKIVQPYFGFGASLLMNRVKSDQPGPGSYALIVQGLPAGEEKLNSTSLGWAVQFPFGVRVPIAQRMFLYSEFRVARHFFSFVSSDAFQRERDRFALQTFQFLLGIGRTF